MEPYKLDASLDANKVFLVKRSELENRIDPNPYSKDRVEAIKSLAKNNQLLKLKDVIKSNKAVVKDISSEDIYIGLENIISDTGEYIETSEKDSIGSANSFKKGQILFPKLRPYLNKVYYTEFDGLCSTEFHVFESKTKDFDTEFLSIYLRLSLIVNQTKHLMTGNTLPRLQTSDIENLPIPKIDKEIQQQIVDIYNHAYTQKQAKEAEAKELLASIDTYLLNELGITLPEKDNSLEARIFTTNFSEVVGGRFDGEFYTEYNKSLLKSIKNSFYQLDKIRNNCEFISGYAFSSETYVENSDCILITIKNISENGIDLKNVTYLPNEYYEYYKRFIINKNDLLIAMTGATIGKVGIYEKDVKALLNQRNGIIKSDKMNTFYLMNLLNTNLYQTLILRNAVGGAQPNISETDIMKLQIPLPPLEKQNEIAEYIASIRSKAKALQQEAEQILAEAKQQVEQMILG